MSKKLVIYLPTADTEQPIWATDGISYVGEIEQLQFEASEKEVVVVVPAQDVVMMMVDLPKMSRARQLQALPFAVEEQIIGDLETQHFAAGHEQVGLSLPVAIVEKQKLEAWMNLLKSWKIMPAYMISSVFLLPYSEFAWHVWQHDDMAIVRQDKWRGFACDIVNLNACVQEHSVETVTTGLAELMQATASLAKIDGVNLLQGDFATKGANRTAVRLGWKVATALGIAFVVTLFLNPLVSITILGQKVHALNAQIADIYKRQFPDSVNMIAPKQRMQEKWQHLANEAGEDLALRQLAILGKAKVEVPSIKISRLDYQNGISTLEVVAANSDDFSNFTQSLSNHGLVVKEQNANLVEGRINASIQISAS